MSINKIKIKIFSLSLFLSLITSLFLINQRYYFPYKIAIEMQSSKDDFLQIYYSSKSQNFTESNSLSIPLKQTNNLDNYSIIFTAKNINDLRIDPSGDFKIKSIIIQNQYYKYVYKDNDLLNKIKPINQIINLSLINNLVVGKTTGDDPYFLLTNIPTINPFPNTQNFLVFGCFVIFFFPIFYLIVSNYKKIKILLFTNKETDINIPQKIFNIFLFLIFAWFTFQMCFFATKIKYGISPDEAYHYELINFYSNPQTFFIKDNINTYFLGPVSTVPYFYHLFIGKLVILNIFHISPYLYLRFINILISLISIYFVYLFTKEITKNKLTQLAVLNIQTNILMYVFISSMISYDNLINLLSIASFLLLFKFLKNYSRIYLLGLGILMLIGSLTKITYPPLVILQFGILLLFSKKIFTNKNKIFKNKLNFKEIILGFIFLLFLVLNIKLYGINLIKYHQIFPSVDKVLGYETASKYYSQYIRDTSILSTANQRTVLSFNQFFKKYINRTEETIFGIMAYKNLFKYDKDLNLYKTIISLALILSIFNIINIYKNKKIIILFIISFLYMFIIMTENYLGYKKYNLFGLGLQGRYNFPILAIAITFLLYNLFVKFSNKIKILILLLITILFIYNGFFWFLQHTALDWYV